jgi:carbonic anhydrase
MRATRPDYFERLVATQAPEYLWIGCADSRVPANEILGLAPGEVFVQRNVGNLAVPRDMNAMACLEYAVDVLKVKHVIVCGHYGCGAVKGALELPAAAGGFVAHWISDIRATRDRHAAALRGLPSQTARWDRLCELNVVHQVFNVTLAPIIQAAWARGQGVAVHGLVYSLADGLLKEVCSPIACGADMEAAAAQAEAAAVAGDESDAMLGEAFSTHQWFATEAAKDVREKQAGGDGAKGEAGGACCAGGGACHAAHAAAEEKAAATAGS